MTQVTATTDNPAGAAFGLQITALTLIEQLVMARPDQAYIERVRTEVLTNLKNTVPTGIPMDQEKSYLDAAMITANFIFDHIAWRGQE